MHLRSLRTAAVIAVLALSLAACGKKTLTLSSFDGTKTVDVTVEIADSPKEREKGLMNRTSLEPESGMLFVFKNPQVPAFWMKNTKIPLEIFFFDEAGTFVSVHSMIPCEADPCTVYKAAALSKYALEVAPGFREEHGIGVGWKLDLEQAKKIAKPT